MMPVDATSNTPPGTAMHGQALIACHDCDLLQRERTIEPGGIARCSRCGAELYRNRPDSLDRSLAYALGALILYVIANAFPIVGLEAGANRVHTTLMGSVLTLYEQEMRLVAGLVFLTTILAPLVQLAGLAYLLLPLKLNRTPPHAAIIYRAMNLASAWSMAEVFMLGILVALVKLSHIAAVVPGIALWSFGGLMLLLAAAAGAFDTRAFWSRLEAVR
jgi:paraquat-inducible protein A